ncbi:unnamed protein product [Brassica oleracea var. botrytis]
MASSHIFFRFEASFVSGKHTKSREESYWESTCSCLMNRRKRN